MTHRFCRRLVGYVLGFVLVIVAPMCALAGPTRAATVAGHRFAREAQRGWIARDANPQDPWLYVTGNQSNEVAIYDLSASGFTQIGDITQGISSPADVAVDAQGTVYVANETGTVTIYPAGSTTPSLTLSQGLEQPQGVAVDVNGDVYVANRGAAPNIPVYAAGQTAPYETITGGLIQVPTQMEFDAQRTLYVTDNNTVAYKLPSGSQQVESLGLKHVSGGGGFALDSVNGGLFISGVARNVHSVWAYAPGNSHPERKLKGGGGADTLAFGEIGGSYFLFVPDSGNNRVGLYPEDGKKAQITIQTSVRYLVGIAYKPAGVP